MPTRGHFGPEEWDDDVVQRRELTAMQSTWVKPDFEVISVSGECTAYAGSL
jgi:hypothetical protein